MTNKNSNMEMNQCIDILACANCEDDTEYCEKCMESMCEKIAEEWKKNGCEDNEMCIDHENKPNDEYEIESCTDCEDEKTHCNDCWEKVLRNIDKKFTAVTGKNGKSICGKCNKTETLDDIDLCKACFTKEIRNARARKCYTQTREKVLVKQKKYREENLDTWNATAKKTKLKNIKKLRVYWREYEKKRYHNNPKAKIKRNLNCRLHKLLHKNGRTFEDYLGCEKEFFMAWLEYNFDDKMNWDNQGTYWHIDHAKPCSSYNLEDNDEAKKCFNWTNLHPMSGKENMSKGDEIDEDLIESIKKRAKKFKKKYDSEELEN
jgi:hypothetical protein